jgi:hypothetical protein
MSRRVDEVRWEHQGTSADAEASRQRVIDYALTFGSASGQRVLEDLKHHCYAERTTFHVDAAEMARREGKREMWLYIQRLVQMTTAPKEPPLSEAETDG